MKPARRIRKAVRREQNVSVEAVCSALETLAPSSLAQPWDNVGLLVGDPVARVRRILLCIDLTPTVLDDAIRRHVEFVVAYHPPIFKPVHRLRTDSMDTDAIAFRCAQAGIAIYSPHTALDAAEGGTNDVMAAIAGIREVEPLVFVDEPGASRSKLVVFVPVAETDRVADALFDAGAGRIGAYEQCSFRISGRGTFFGGTSTNPAIGARERLEHVDEIRLEVIVPTDRLPNAIQAMRRAHSYDEPAFDVYPLKPRPTPGIGRIGRFPKPITLDDLSRRLQRATAASNVQVVGQKRQQIQRAVIVVGSAGSLPFRASLNDSDVVITGEIRHHDALAFQRRGTAAVAIGHWASERPVLKPLREQLRTRLRSVEILISTTDSDPFRSL